MRSPIGSKKLSNEKKARLSSDKNVRTLREGYACSQLIEPLPKFNAAQGEEVTGALVATRMNKKKAADDAKLLANRIALLKLEEKKAWKKIQETKKKAE